MPIYSGTVFSLDYSLSRISHNQVLIKIYLNNNTSSEFKQLSIKVAVKKSFKILSNQLNFSNVPAKSQGLINQSLLIERAEPGHDLALKTNIAFIMDGVHVNETVFLNNLN